MRVARHTENNATQTVFASDTQRVAAAAETLSDTDESLRVSSAIHSTGSIQRNQCKNACVAVGLNFWNKSFTGTQTVDTSCVAYL